MMAYVSHLLKVNVQMPLLAACVVQWKTCTVLWGEVGRGGSWGEVQE